MLTPALEATLAEVHAFVASDQGQQRIHAALLRRRLPGSFDTEIEEAVLSEALRFLTQGGEITSVPGWCSSRITARSIDLARGAIRAQRAIGIRTSFDEQDIHATDTVDQDTIEQDAIDQDTIDQDDLTLDLPIFNGANPHRDSQSSNGAMAKVRTALLDADAAGIDIAAALTVVAVLADEAALHSACPQPLAGADQQDAACWAGLWYAHRNECFGPGNAVTQRRSRAAKRIKHLLITATTQLSQHGMSRNGMSQNGMSQQGTTS
jgi:hypothetical protein